MLSFLAVTVDPTPITNQTLIVCASVIGTCLALGRAGIWVLDRFYAKKDEAKKTAESEKTGVLLVEQSAACRFDHQNLTAILQQQNAHISKLLEHMGSFLHSAELRHQALIAKMEFQQAELQERLRNIYHQMPKSGHEEH